MAKVRGRNVRYVPNNKSFGEFMMSEQAREPVLKAAHDVVEQAAADAVKKTGDYASSFKVNDAVTVTLGGNPRAAAEVYNSNGAAASQEFGHAIAGGVQPGHRTLRRAGEVAVGPPPAGGAL